MATKKSGPASDDIMSPAELKPLLTMSKREPVNAAIGMTKDHEGVILLSRRIKPKRLLAQLKADARKAKIDLDVTSLRFGKAEVDTDIDPGLVQFTVNKEAPGALRMKLLELLKRVPYAKVDIGIDQKFEDEPEEEEEEHAAPPPPGLMQRMEAGAASLADKVVDLARSVAGSEASDADLKKLKDDLEKGERTIEIATKTGMVPAQQVEKLKKAGDALGKMASWLGTAETIRADLRAILEIHDALKELDDPNVMQPGSREAAKAFGRLFEGAGTIAEQLPEIDTYAPILKGCVNFFSDIQRLNDPETSPNEGPQFQQLEP